MSITTTKTKDTEEIAESPTKKYYITENENAGESQITGEKILPAFDMKKKKVFHCFFSGATGSGKSYLARKCIEQIKPKFVFIFSSIDDGDYDNIKGVRTVKVDLNKIMLEQKLDIHAIYETMPDNCISVFDDIISFGAKLAKPYIELRLILLQKGRHRGQSVFVCEQQSMSGNAKGSREVLLNCSRFFCFPRSNFNSFQKLAKNYLGLNEEQIQKCKSLGRWIMINKNYPSYYVSEKEVGIFNN